MCIAALVGGTINFCCVALPEMVCKKKKLDPEHFDSIAPEEVTYTLPKGASFNSVVDLQKKCKS